jgi:hypothetical protein
LNKFIYVCEAIKKGNCKKSGIGKIKSETKQKQCCSKCFSALCNKGFVALPRSVYLMFNQSYFDTEFYGKICNLEVLSVKEGGALLDSIFHY